MSITKPYFNIYRPMMGGRKSKNEDYLLDDGYAPTRQHAIQAYGLLEDDLIDMFRYVEPGDANLATYSHEIYQLFLRACTEFESHAKTIMSRNGAPSSRLRTMQDYWKIEQACRLSEYQVRFPGWRGCLAVRAPFSDWRTSHSLSWYKDYNSVKHDRYGSFEKANLKNVLDAVSGVLVILFAQVQHLAFGRYRPAGYHRTSGPWFLPVDGMIEICPPQTWSDAEKYDFDWSALESDQERFQRFSF